ncbi:MAG: PAS domain S-box protein [Anaerolineae bacterium]|nr:PAS domain S-box protein [Anaerolineae bacterium]
MSVPELKHSRNIFRLVAFQALLLAILISVILIVSINQWVNTSIENAHLQQQESLMRIVTLVDNVIQPTLNEVRNGEISRQEGVDVTRQLVRRMTYEDQNGPNYVFMVTYDGLMLVQPFLPENEGTNQWNLQDINGVYIVQNLARVARLNPQGGFFEYYYTSPNSDQPEKKISFVKDVPELGVFIGTGAYQELFIRQQRDLLVNAQWILAGFVFFQAIFTLYFLYRFHNNNRMLENEIIERRKAQQDILLSEENLKTVFNSAYDAIIIHSYDGRIVQVNQRMLQMFAVDQEQVLQKTVLDITSADENSRDKLLEIWEGIRQGQERIFEWKSRRLDNHDDINVEVGLRPIHWYGKDAVLAVVRDISSRKKIEQDLINNQVMLEHAQEMARVGHFIFDVETHFVTWSKELYRIYGRNPDMPPPDVKEHQQIVKDNAWQKIVDQQRVALETGKSIRAEYRISRPDGEERDLFVIMDCLTDATGKIIAHTGTIQDITDQKLINENLRASEERFRTIVEQMSEGVVLVGEDGRILEWNLAQENITGLKRGDVLGQLIWDVQSSLGLPENKEVRREKIKSAMQAALNSGVSPMFNSGHEVLLHLQDGTIKTLIESVFAVHTGTGYRIASIVRDITEQKQADEKINLQVKKLKGLRGIDLEILNQSSLSEILEVILNQIREVLKADAANIISLDAKLNRLTPIVSYGFKTDRSDCKSLRHFSCLPWQVMNRKGFMVIQKNDKVGTNCNCLNEEGFATFYGAPIIANQKTVGILEVFFYENTVLDPEWVDYFESLAGQAAIAIETVYLFEDLQRSNVELNQAYEATITGWSKALELRDEETQGHSDRVMHLACELALRLGMNDVEMVHFRRGVLLHDIGKMGVPDHILLKPGPLTDDEWRIMRKHPEFAYRLLSQINYLKPALDVPYAHHERWNGSGYPRGLMEKEIPWEARIFMVVDVWDALISDRPYRPGWNKRDVINYLRENSGVLFDPQIVIVFLDMIDEIGDDLPIYGNSQFL